MTRLRSKLLGLNRGKPDPEKTKVYSPANCEALRLPIRTEKTAKVVGKLAERLAPFHLKSSTPGNGDEVDEKRQKTEEEGQLVSGVLVQNDLKLSLMAPEDLREYAGLTTTTITCRQKITLASASIELIRWALEGTFGGIKDLTQRKEGVETNGDGHVNHQEAADEEIDRTEYKFLVMDTVTVSYRQQGAMELEWEGNMMNDGIADAVMAVLLTVESSPAAVKRELSIVPSLNHANRRNTESSKLHSHSHHHHDAKTKATQTNGETPSKPITNGTSSSSLTDRRQNPHTNTSPEQKLSRLLLFLEAQFGADAIIPISHPKLPTHAPPTAATITNTITNDTTTIPFASKPETAAVKEDSSISKQKANDATTEQPNGFTTEEHDELTRLHSLGIPVPGLLIRVDKHEARVWLEDLSVECANGGLRERVSRVVQRGVECVSGLWGGAEGGV